MTEESFIKLHGIYLEDITCDNSWTSSFKEMPMQQNNILSLIKCVFIVSLRCME